MNIPGAFMQNLFQGRPKCVMPFTVFRNWTRVTYHETYVFPIWLRKDIQQHKCIYIHVHRISNSIWPTQWFLNHAFLCSRFGEQGFRFLWLVPAAETEWLRPQPLPPQPGQRSPGPNELSSGDHKHNQNRLPWVLCSCGVLDSSFLAFLLLERR